MSTLSAFNNAFKHVMDGYIHDMLDDDKWVTLWMSPPEHEAYKARRKFWAEHEDEARACRGIELLAKAQYAEFVIRLCEWVVCHTEIVGPYELVVLMRHAEDRDDQHGKPEVVLTNLSDVQLNALSATWPGKYSYNGDDFSDWLISMRLADPAPADSIRWLYY